MAESYQARKTRDRIVKAWEEAIHKYPDSVEKRYTYYFVQLKDLDLSYTSEAIEGYINSLDQGISASLIRGNLTEMNEELLSALQKMKQSLENYK